MRLSKFDLPGKWSFVHAAIGGGICFFVISLLFDVAQMGLQQLLISFHVVGVMIFKDPFVLARDIFMFGVVYVSSGFCGGLYTGYKVEEDLKIVLAVPGIIGFAAFTVLYCIVTQSSPLNMNVAGEILFPLLGSVVGAYLGGYTLNWPSEEEEEAGKLTLELGE